MARCCVVVLANASEARFGAGIGIRHVCHCHSRVCLLFQLPFILTSKGPPPYLESDRLRWVAVECVWRATREPSGRKERRGSIDRSIWRTSSLSKHVLNGRVDSLAAPPPTPSMRLAPFYMCASYKERERRSMPRMHPSILRATVSANVRVEADTLPRSAQYQTTITEPIDQRGSQLRS